MSSRLLNVRRNLKLGIIGQAVSVLLSFGVRTTLIYVLGAQYQGLSGVFSSILEVLNLTELGFSAAVTCVLYKPIAENDTPLLHAILYYMRRVYRYIGMTVLCLGVFTYFLLPWIIPHEIPANINIHILYFLYLASAVVSYFSCAYKTTFLSAAQRDDLVSRSKLWTDCFIKGLQIILLLLFQDYYFFVILIPIGSMINNVFIGYYTRVFYGECNYTGELSVEIKKYLLSQVKAICINRVGDVARNALDNIVISMFIGLYAVTAYGNYYTIYASVYAVMGMMIRSIKASIGNAIVTESVEKNYTDCMQFNFSFMWLVGWLSICMFCLYQSFIRLWMHGNTDLMLSFCDMGLFCLYFYVINATYTILHTLIDHIIYTI